MSRVVAAILATPQANIDNKHNQHGRTRQGVPEPGLDDRQEWCVALLNFGEILNGQDERKEHEESADSGC